jgi:hypothetical protein
MEAPPGDPPDPPLILGKDKKKTCASCGHRGHPSALSVYCPNWTASSVRDSVRDYGGGRFWYRPYIWKCAFDTFSKAPPVSDVILSCVVAVSRARFEATRFLQLFLGHISPNSVLALTDTKINNLLKTFFEPSDDDFNGPLKRLAGFDTSAPDLFRDVYLPCRGQAIWPGDVESTKRLSGSSFLRFGDQI